MNRQTLTMYRPITLKNKKQRVHGRRPIKKEYKLYIHQYIDYSGIGYEYNITENNYYNNIIVVEESRVSGINCGDYAGLYTAIKNNVIEYDALYYALEDVNKRVPGRDYETMTEAVKDILNVTVTPHAAGKIRKILNKATCAYYLNYYSENDRAAELLTVLTPYTWRAEIIRGYSQGDAAVIIYPVDIYDPGDVKYFESFYFGKYYDYSITYKGYTTCDYIPDFIAWDQKELFTRCAYAVGVPSGFDHNNIVFSPAV